MIEIRELVIRATVEDSSRNNVRGNIREDSSVEPENNGCSAENIDMILKIIKEKRER